MKYDISYLINKINNGERLKYICFWGHQPGKDGKISHTCFSQWWLSDFTVEGITYKTAEHWMMAKKAELFNDREVKELILNSKTPGEAKALGRKVRDYNEEIWVSERFNIVTEGNFHKFSQNPELKEFLINTENRILVEASPVDNIWGVGLTKNDALIQNPETWKGLNLLGFALMEVRDTLTENE